MKSDKQSSMISLDAASKGAKKYKTKFENLTYLSLWSEVSRLYSLLIACYLRDLWLKATLT